MQFEYDTSTGTPNYAYTWSAIFSLPAGSSAPPSSYTNNLTGTTELHQLTYDAQGRIVKDSSLGSSGWVIYFSYPANEIAITALYDGTIANSIVDTLFLSNGNIGSAHTYGPNNAGTADSLGTIDQVSALAVSATLPTTPPSRPASVHCCTFWRSAATAGITMRSHKRHLTQYPGLAMDCPPA